MCILESELADRLSATQRSWNMSKIKAKNTKPEIFIRKFLFSLGFRYRVNYSGLPGKPDIVFPKRKKVIFIHGCFWHRHNCLSGEKKPRTNKDYWIPKLERNKERDIEIEKKLIGDGWKLIVIWECEIKKTETVHRILDFLNQN